MFLNEIFEVNKDLIDDNNFTRQFNLYVQYDKDKLMNFMQKTGKFPKDGEKICEDANLYVEQAYILLSNTNSYKDEIKRIAVAQDILLKRSNSENFQKCIILAIQFNFIDEFIKKLITKANKNTADVNVLMEYIDYLHNPQQII